MMKHNFFYKLKRYISAICLMLCLFHFVGVNSLVVASNLSSRPVLLAQDDGDVTETLKNIDKTTSCGNVGQACCEAKVRFPRPKIKVPSLAGLGTVINLLLTPINTILGAVNPTLIGWTESIVQHFVDRTPCHGDDTIASDATHIDKCVCLRQGAFNIGQLCLNIKDPGEKSACINCKGVWTAIGCVDSKVELFIANRLFGLGVGLAGTVSLLCIIYASFILQTSAGNPERIKKGREYLTSCIVGLLLVIFSVFVLQVIGVTILRIPGFQ